MYSIHLTLQHAGRDGRGRGDLPGTDDQEGETAQGGALPAATELAAAPALEAQLAESASAGYTGRVDLSFYRSGLRLQLDEGRLTGVETWQPSTDRPGHVGLPGLTFLQLLFGFRSLHELRDFLPDCVVRNETVGAVVEGLFPPQVSDLMLTD